MFVLLRIAYIGRIGCDVLEGGKCDERGCSAWYSETLELDHDLNFFFSKWLPLGNRALSNTETSFFEPIPAATREARMADAYEAGAARAEAEAILRSDNATEVRQAEEDLVEGWIEAQGPEPAESKFAYLAWTRVINNSGCPNHPGDYANAISFKQTQTILGYPVLAEKTFDLSCYRGAVGIALNGVRISSMALSDAGVCPELELDGSHHGLTHDGCGGGVGQSVYSYMLPPACLIPQLDQLQAMHSGQLGWSLDGFPIYGPVGPDGIYIQPCENHAGVVEEAILDFNAGFATAEEARLALQAGEDGYSPDYCLDECGGMAGALPKVDEFLYRYYMTGARSSLRCLKGCKYEDIIQKECTPKAVGVSSDYILRALDSRKGPAGTEEMCLSPTPAPPAPPMLGHTNRTKHTKQCGVCVNFVGDPCCTPYAIMLSIPLTLGLCLVCFFGMRVLPCCTDVGPSKSPVQTAAANDAEHGFPMISMVDSIGPSPTSTTWSSGMWESKSTPKPQTEMRSNADEISGTLPHRVVGATQRYSPASPPIEQQGRAVGTVQQQGYPSAYSKGSISPLAPTTTWDKRAAKGGVFNAFAWAEHSPDRLPVVKASLQQHTGT
jgi:hypothetical protein